MTFTDKWGTEYPESVRKFVNSTGTVDIDRNVMDVASTITKIARTTDEAILEIHGFVKNAIKVGNVPGIIDVPVMKASTMAQRLLDDPGAKNYSHNKTVFEVALLRSLNIPARIATYDCQVKKRNAFLSDRRFKSMLTLPESYHHATEVYTKDADGGWRFKLKESWLPEERCAEFDGTCTDDERNQWMEKREIRGIQNHLECSKVRSDPDYPAAFENVIKAGTAARKYSHVLDLIDPIEE